MLLSCEGEGWGACAGAGSAPGGSGADGLTSALKGKTVLVVGVGGAGSAIAFGATHAGARVRLTTAPHHSAWLSCKS